MDEQQSRQKTQSSVDALQGQPRQVRPKLIKHFHKAASNTLNLLPLQQVHEPKSSRRQQKTAVSQNTAKPRPNYPRGNTWLLITKNIFSWRFLLLVAMPLLVLLGRLLVQLPIQDVAHLLHGWIGAEHYYRTAGLIGILLVWLLMSLYVQILLTPFLEARAMMGDDQKAWLPVGKLVLVTALFGSLALASILVSGWVMLHILLGNFVISISVMTWLSVIGIAEVITLIFFGQCWRLAQIHLVTTGATLRRALRVVLNSWWRQFSSFVGFGSMVIFYWLAILIVIGLYGALLYVAFFSLMSDFFLQTLAVFGGLWLSLLAIMWLDTLSIRAWRRWYAELKKNVAKRYRYLFARSVRVQTEYWSAWLMLAAIVLILFSYGMYAYLKQTELKQDITKLQARLPKSSQRVIPATDMHYNVK